MICKFYNLCKIKITLVIERNMFPKKLSSWPPELAEIITRTGHFHAYYNYSTPNSP